MKEPLFVFLRKDGPQLFDLFTSSAPRATPSLLRDKRDVLRHDLRHLRPGLGAGHPGGVPRVHGAAAGRVAAALAAQVDGDARQELQAADAQRIDLSLLGTIKQ